MADRVLEKEKDKQVGQVFSAGFSWSEMFDALADVYLGVSNTILVLDHKLISVSSHSGLS